MKKVFYSLAAGVIALASASASAGVLTLNGGWQQDQINTADPDPSVLSPYAVDLPDGGIFRITDEALVGDTYFVRDNGNLILTTVIGAPPSNPGGFGGDPSADAAWQDSGYGHGEIILGAGSHSLSISGDGVAGLPAGFAIRLDMPEPSTIALLGFGAAGLLGFSARRRAAKNKTKA